MSFDFLDWLDWDTARFLLRILVECWKIWLSTRPRKRLDDRPALPKPRRNRKRTKRKSRSRRS